MRSMICSSERFFQVALLAGRQVVVEDDQTAVFFRADVLELSDLALADVGGGVGRFETLGHGCCHMDAGRGGQLGQLCQRVGESPATRLAAVELHADEACPLRLPGSAEGIASLANGILAIGVV